MIELTLVTVSFVALSVIFCITIAMALSCYDSGVFGTIALCFMCLAVFSVLFEFNQYALSRPSMILTIAVAIWMARNWVNHLRYQRRRQREREQVVTWPIGGA